MIGPPALWTVAVGGSVMLHCAIGMALYAMPMPETKKPARTEINIARLDTGAAMRRAPLAAAQPVRADRSAVIVPRAAVPPAAMQTGPAPVVLRDATELRKSAAPASLQPAKGGEAIRVETSAQVVAASDTTTIEAGKENPEQAITRPPDVVRIAPSAPLPVAQELKTAPAAALAKPPTPVAEAPAGTPREVMAEAVRAVGAAPTETAVVSVEPTTPSINLDAILAPSPGVKPERPHSGPLIHPSTQATTEAGLSTLPASTTMAGSLRPSASTAPTAVAPVGLAPAGTTSTAAAVVAPTSPGAGLAPVVAMLPRPNETVVKPSIVAPPSGRMRIADFLAEQEGADCMLALPTGMGSTQATIEAFAAVPEVVDRLGAEYERLSGMRLTADTRPVSRQQCSALAFARSLAQYPNFPLRVSLAEPSIRSGRALSGVISGLRKNTLYLMIVDDEGKAELVTSYPNQRASVMNFSAPMTLTSGPVSSVQLLVAIASDGPLRTVPNKPGMPAEEYFSRLATEIIMDDRSIAYGITSFVVQ